VTISDNPTDPFTLDQSPRSSGSAASFSVEPIDPRIPLDVNSNGNVAALDALVIIDQLSSKDASQGAGERLAERLDQVMLDYDLNRDAKVSARSRPAPADTIEHPALATSPDIESRSVHRNEETLTQDLEAALHAIEEDSLAASKAKLDPRAAVFASWPPA
jgi:hypothetical protein